MGMMPKLCEGWSWKLTRPVVEDRGEFYPKVRIELLLHDDVRRSATIDVGMYGDAAAVFERAQAMVQSVAAEQLAHVAAPSPKSCEGRKS